LCPLPYLHRHCAVSSPPCYTGLPFLCSSTNLEWWCHRIQLHMPTFKVLSLIKHLLCFSWYRMQNFGNSNCSNEMENLGLKYEVWNSISVWIQQLIK
jgi:hypothetical protein